jgi:hypothetical protein
MMKARQLHDDDDDPEQKDEAKLDDPEQNHEAKLGVGLLLPLGGCWGRSDMFEQRVYERLL